jgi:hypothetical protein
VAEVGSFSLFTGATGFEGVVMSVQKPTSSATKLATWAWIRALDKAAMVLIRQGVGVAESYRKALESVGNQRPTG